MKIQFDTKKDSRDEIKKLIKTIADILSLKKEELFDDYMALNSSNSQVRANYNQDNFGFQEYGAKQSASENNNSQSVGEGFFNMFDYSDNTAATQNQNNIEQSEKQSDGADSADSQNESQDKSQAKKEQKRNEDLDFEIYEY